MPVRDPRENRPSVYAAVAALPSRPLRPSDRRLDSVTSRMQRTSQLHSSAENL